MPQYNRNDLEIAARNLHFTGDRCGYWFAGDRDYRVIRNSQLRRG